MRTAQEIEAEIQALEACKAYAPKENAFGDNNHRNIDLQIEELRYGIDETAAEFDEFSDSEQLAIIEAKYWKDGEEGEGPHAGWDDYKTKKQ